VEVRVEGDDDSAVPSGVLDDVGIARPREPDLPGVNGIVPGSAQTVRG
jgi:hypothetical protein